MKCHKCGARIAPRNTHLNEDFEVVCGECYLRTATPEEIAAVLDAIEIESR